MFDDDFIWLVQQANLGQYGTDLFKGPKAIIPSGPGPYISFIETGGSSPEGTHNSTLVPAYLNVSAQVLTRGENYDATMTKALALWFLLFPVRNRLVNNTWWRQVRMLQSRPFSMGMDETGRRVRLAFNFEAVIRSQPEGV